MNKLFGRLVIAAALSAISGYAAAAAPHVNKAIDAMGGAALHQLRTMVVKAQTKHWEPDQSVQAGGELRFAADAALTDSRDFISGNARLDWAKKLVYPSTRDQNYSEIISGEVGYVRGIDSGGRTKADMESNPPQHVMSGKRAAATMRELARSSPTLLLEMDQYPKRVSALPPQAAGKRKLPALRYAGERATFTVLFDPATGLPERIRTPDFDSLQGDSNYDLVYSDWRQVGAIRYPFRQTYELNGRTVFDIRVDEARANVELAAGVFEIPQAIRAAAPKLPSGKFTHQWFLRRQFIGNLLDSDGMAYDTTAASGQSMVDIGPGIAQFRGSHNTLFIEMDKYLVAVDAPIDDSISKNALAAAAKKFPGKPVRYVVLTHHHMDHTSGIRTYAAAGAEVIVGKGNGAFFRRTLSTPATQSADAPQKKPRGSVREVDGRWIITDGKRDVGVYPIDTTHAAGMVMAYVHDARLGAVTDLWGPGRDPMPPKINAGLQAVVDTVNRFNLDPERFAGGHGTVGDYAPLARLAAAR